MTDVYVVFMHFLMSLALGTILFLPMVASELTGVGFIKIILWVAISTMTIPLISIPVFDLWDHFSEWNYMVMSLSFFLGAGLLTLHQDLRQLRDYLMMIALLGCALFYQASFFGDQWALGLYSCILMLFVGGINFMMILGHYYLVVPKLTTRPLMLMLLALLIVYILRQFIVLLYSNHFQLWTEFFRILFYAENSAIDLTLLVFSIFQQLCIYVGIPLLGFFSYQLVKLRSIQSATGLFYVMTFFALIDAFISYYFVMIRSSFL